MPTNSLILPRWRTATLLALAQTALHLTRIWRGRREILFWACASTAAVEAATLQNGVWAKDVRLGEVSSIAIPIDAARVILEMQDVVCELGGKESAYTGEVVLVFKRNAEPVIARTNDENGWFDPQRSVYDGVATGSPFVVTAPRAGTYYFKANQCVPFRNIKSYSLRVEYQYAPPQISLQPKSVQVALGQPAAVFVAATGSPRVYYQWFKDGAQKGREQTLSIPVAAISDAGSYWADVSTDPNFMPAQTVTSNRVNLSVGQSATSTRLPPITEVVDMSSGVNLTITATGAPPITYHWSFFPPLDSGEPPGVMMGSSPKFNIPGRRKWERYVVRCEIESYGAPIMTTETTVSVIYPPKVMGITSNQTRKAGESCTLSVIAEGNPGPTYQWRKGTTDINGATEKDYTIPSLSLSDAGTYTCKLSNKVKANIVSPKIVLTVIP